MFRKQNSTELSVKVTLILVTLIFLWLESSVKVDGIRLSTASADPPVLVTRKVSPLNSFRPAMVAEVVKLLKDTPAKSCELDPVPTWLLKQISPYIAPTICQLCNLSLERGVFTAQLK